MTPFTLPVQRPRAGRRVKLDVAGPARRGLAPWEIVVLVLGIAGAVAALVVTLRADFLAHPQWLAVEKAVMIAAPIAVGLYWHRHRPDSRFGPLLIVLGLAAIPYILQSVDASMAFSIGTQWEQAIYLVTVAVTLTFPSGRLDGLAERVTFGAAILLVAIPAAVIFTMMPTVAPSDAISGCAVACPDNAFHFGGDLDTAHTLLDEMRVAVLLVAAATAAILIVRFATGSAPRRRALGVGTPIVLLFLACQIAYQVTRLASDGESSVLLAFQWVFAAARALLPFGFLLALVASQLFAARVLDRIVLRSLRRPDLRQLERLLRGPLGDPALQLAYRDARSGRWIDDRGAVLDPPTPAPGQLLTIVEQDARRAVGIIHDEELADDPELLRAAGAVALLARENAELEAAWDDSLRQLRDSRARIASASATERRRIERDLHDGVQQRLVALAISLSTARHDMIAGLDVERRLLELQAELEITIAQLREVSHGIYPATLAQAGLVEALRVGTRGAATPVEVAGHLSRHPSDVESGVYYCCLEAVQNGTKHAGPGASIVVHLEEDDHALRFEVRDDGLGFDTAERHAGDGVRNMQARIAALDGELVVTSSPGLGTLVAGRVPIHQPVGINRMLPPVDGDAPAGWLGPEPG